MSEGSTRLGFPKGCWVMVDPEKPASLQELAERLKAARNRQETGRAARKPAVSSRGMSAGFRIAVEMLAALVVGTGMGLLLDYWLGTRPWLMILFFFLGSAAAFRNVVRTANQLEAERRRENAAKKAQDGAAASRGAAGSGTDDRGDQSRGV